MHNRDNLICDNVGLVHSCAKRFKGRGIEYDDLYQAGCMGLIKAADGFDSERGFKFSTYAVPVILGEMKRLFRDGGSIKVGRALKELSLKVSRESERFLKAEERSPTVSELAEILSVDSNDIVQAIGAGIAPLSLTVSSEDDERELDVEVEAPEEKISDLLALKQVISDLSAKDRKLIIMRYFKENTQTQTAKVLGMSQVQVSRREKVILKELKDKLIAA